MNKEKEIRNAKITAIVCIIVLVCITLIVPISKYLGKIDARNKQKVEIINELKDQIRGTELKVSLDSLDYYGVYEIWLKQDYERRSSYGDYYLKKSKDNYQESQLLLTQLKQRLYELE